tara:strand:+ start:2055 stop:3398 length:1344 start_codon:yes stop_codon:yes gene_type:complete
MTVNNEMLSSNIEVGNATGLSELGADYNLTPENAISFYNVGANMSRQFPINGNSRAWKHDVNSAYNHFYNAPVAPSSVEVVSNDNPSSVKIFKSLSIESSTAEWEGEVYTNEDRGEEAQQQGAFLKFIEKEGVQWAEMPKDLINSTGNIYLVGRVRLKQQLLPFDNDGNWIGNYIQEYNFFGPSLDANGDIVAPYSEEGDVVPTETWDVPLWGPPISGFGTGGGSGVFFGKSLLSVTEDGEIYSALPQLYPGNPDSYGYKKNGIKLLSYTNSHQPISHLTGDWKPPNSIRLRLGRTNLSQQQVVLTGFIEELLNDVEAFSPWTSCAEMGFPPCTPGCFTDYENFDLGVTSCSTAFFGYEPTEEDLEAGYFSSGAFSSAVITDPNAFFEINKNGWVGVYVMGDPSLNGDMMRGPYAGIKLTLPSPSEPIELFAINVDYEKTKLDGSLG